MVNRIIGHFKQKRIEAEEARAREQAELLAADEDSVRQEAQIGIAHTCWNSKINRKRSRKER